nr:retrovirus-related Pol polyprotein from transposon TNT 1-94 [Tanacetum cinerariifolium]
MIMRSKDNLYNGRKGIGFENPSYFEKAKDLRPTLYDEKVIGLGYTLMFLIHSDEALEIKKFKRSRENKIEFAYDYVNLNASYQTSSLKPYVPNVILEKIIFDLEDEVHMTGNRALLTNFVEKFLGKVRFGNNDCAVIAGYGDVIIDSGCSKHMTGNRALLTNFVEKFLGTVRFGNNVFVVIAGYGEEIYSRNLCLKLALSF